ncbi:hypothetical protein [Yinghuangia seranimata]|uniref:hypothetical protein n=1 Tax=Yinghuangia seranimata TaxID=408067 RepID=UPI00248AB884|nr:hypothetical protein [Yinghuangia seranimata]MDI2127478.1 hypothetical protein [Yinghuangia seranimata]
MHTAAANLRRLAVLPVLGLVLVGTAACDSGDDKAATSGGTPGATVAGQPDPVATGSAPPPRSEPTQGATNKAPATVPKATAPATTAQLTGALLDKSAMPLAGFQIDGTDSAKGKDAQTAAPTDRPDCAVFTQEFTHTAGDPLAWVRRGYAGRSAAGSPTEMGVTLSSYKSGTATTLLASFDKAMAGCAAPFTVTQSAGPEKWAVTPLDSAPMLGDETVAYRVAVSGVQGAQPFARNVVLIRVGDTVAEFMYGPGTDQPDTTPYAPLIAAQVQKVKLQIGR